MIRRCAVGVVAVAAALAVQVLGAHSAGAVSSAREGARTALLRAVGGHWYHGDADADYRAIYTAWAPFADLSHVPPASTAGDSAAFFEQACQPGGILADLSTVEPAPGDLVLYHVSGENRGRLAMFVSRADVVLYNPATADLELHVRQEVTGHDGGGPRLVELDAHVACRFNAALLPGGVDDLTSSHGRVALADPQRTLEHAAWTYGHPRDPDQSVWHQATRTLTGAVSALGNGLLWVLDHAGAGMRALLERTGPFGAAALGLFDMAFDGRRLHRVLTWGLLVMTGTSGLRLASRLGIPFLGSLGDSVWGIGSFAVSLLTGVDDSRKVSVLAVGVNVLLTLTVVGRAAAVGTRLGTLALVRGMGRVGDRALGALNHIANAIDVRPRSIAGIFHRAAAHPAWWDVTDYVSWAWRPGHVASDLISDAANAAGLLGSGKGELIGEYNKLYSSAHTLGELSTGQPLSTPVPTSPLHASSSAVEHVNRLRHDHGLDQP